MGCLRACPVVPSAWWPPAGAATSSVLRQRPAAATVALARSRVVPRIAREGGRQALAWCRFAHFRPRRPQHRRVLGGVAPRL
eukprot:3061147-Alexandrium_andersonii.AAC.1